jgi:hypothetical protein
MLPVDYTNAVLEDYHQKKAVDALPFDMRQLSPASLKAACLEVCRDKYSKKDESLLKAFFENGSDQETFLAIIDNCGIDKFRPLVYFLKKKTTKPDDKVVELVAWLINFKDRPYDPKKDYSKRPGVIQGTPQGPPIDVITGPNPSGSGEPQEGPQPTVIEPAKKKQKNKKIVLTIMILATLGMVAYWAEYSKPVPPVGLQRCMYWAEDHYQPVDCEKKIENTQVIALDTEKVLHFRKITRPDTITTSARGSVWYGRYRGNYEYYTDSGFHPLDPNLRLKPISEYIISRHVPANP